MSGDIELTILMPCLNESETISACIDKAQSYLSQNQISGEILIADNGSTDGSQEIAIRKGARVVKVRERGYGAALIGGIHAARGRYIIMGDADDSYDFSALGPFVSELRAGADLVIGNRFRGGIKPGAMPLLHRYLGNPVLSFLGRLFFRVPVRDFHCGLRGFSREAILRLGLKSPGMEFASEMVVKAALHDLKIKEVATVLHPDGRSRRPHLKTWRDGWRHLRFLLLHNPNWLFIYPGLLLFIVGTVTVITLVQEFIPIADLLGRGIHTLTAACFMALIGVQLLLFGALARRHAEIEGILPPTQNLRGFLLGLTLERLLQVALFLFLIGVIGCVSAFGYWASTGFGAITSQKVLVVWTTALTAIASAVQIAFSGFLASVLSLRAVGNRSEDTADPSTSDAPIPAAEPPSR